MTESVKIREIFISNFRSFAPRDRKLGATVTQLSNINIFVGPNGAGKTNLFNAIRDCLDWKIFNSQGTGTISLNYNDSSKPIEIDVSVKTTDGTRTVRLIRDAQSGDSQPEDNRDPDPKQDGFFQQWIFPLGLSRQFRVFDDLKKQNEKDRSYELITQNWDKIREDASRIKLKLTDIPRPPGRNMGRESDGFFYDILDEYGVPIIEGSDGKASFLFLIVSIRTRKPGSVLLIEEPEVSMHPGLQKQFLEYLKHLAEEDKYQFLISTHSPYLMNFAVTDETEEVAVFRLTKDATDYTQIKLVKNKRAEHWGILTDLGHSPADVLQASCIIWVEGPSDRIYLNHWLKAYDAELREGLHYSIMFYGGRLLSHLSFNDEEIDEFISLRKINPNLAILIDSDRTKKGEAMNPTKCQVRDEFEKGPGFAWVSAGREIENYIPPELMKEAVKNVHRNAVKLASTGQYDHCYHFIKPPNGEVQKENIDKVKIARQVAKFDAELDRFDLREKIRDTTNFIRQCNDLPVR